MDCSRRDLLKGLTKPEFWEQPRKGAVLPDGVDILLDKDACIAWGRGICTRCEDACAEHALFFVGMMNPRVLTDRCTLCADCVAVCPTAAIIVRTPQAQEQTGESA
ncbi:MAG: 4Fe-4S dicluster domain-containing protein [Candidatus Krumholzibacteriota bacterium]